MPSLSALLDVDGRPIRLLATHPLPPLNGRYAFYRRDQLRAVAQYCAASTEPVLLLGDLNASPWSADFRLLLREGGLRNGAQGQGFLMTWPAPLPLLAIQIDHCLHSADLHVRGVRSGPRIGSDHLPLLAEVVLPAAHP